MQAATKQRIFVWVTTLVFAAFVLGRFDRTETGGLVYRVLENGLVSSIFLMIAASLVSAGDQQSLRTGVIMWVLALVALFALKHTTIVSLHF